MNNVGQYGGVPSFGANGLNGNGIDLNLKYHTYTGDVTISNFDLTDTGGSAGQSGAIVVEGRDDPTGYNAIPADVSGLNVTIQDGTIDGTSTGIRAGENKADPAQNNAGPAVTIDSVTVTNALQNSEIDNHTHSLMTVTGTDNADTYRSAQTAGSTGPLALYGKGGDDYLAGGLGNDILQGGTGDDTLDGGTGGIDTADYSDATSDGLVVDLAAGTSTGGGLGNDTLFNIDNLVGSSHNDTLIGDGNDNVLRGGAGDDILNGNGGTNTADYSDATSDGLVVDLSAGTSTGGGLGTDTLSNIQNLIGSAYSDTLIGDGGNNILRGGAGDDMLDGGPGGSDTADYSDATGSGLVVDLMNSVSSGGGLGNDTLSNIQNLSGSAFNDVLMGDDGDNTLIGGAGNDILYGHGGNNSLLGGDGTDVAYYSGLENDLNDPYSVLGTPGTMAVIGGPEMIFDGLTDVERVKFLSPSHVSDVNNDGYGDLVFQDTATGDLTFVQEPEPGTLSGAVGVGGTNWRVVGTGQFNPDDAIAPRNAGVLLQDSGTGDLKVVTDVTGAPAQTALSTQPGMDWKAIATGDFNGDASSDVLLQNQVTGATEVMLLKTSATDAIGTVDSVATVTGPGANWKAIAAGDFNGDGKSDIVWQNGGTKQVEVSLMDGATVAGHSAALAAPNLTVIGTGDFNGDGKSDILFANASGQAVVWFMNGTAHTGTKTISHAMTPGDNWAVSGAADVDGNGYSDVIWTDTNNTGDTSASLLSGSSVNPSVASINLSSPGPGTAFKLIASTGGG
jgi:Ca2+-binding RTX toxin-like protein